MKFASKQNWGLLGGKEIECYVRSMPNFQVQYKMSLQKKKLKWQSAVKSKHDTNKVKKCPPDTRCLLGNRIC